MFSDSLFLSNLSEAVSIPSNESVADAIKDLLQWTDIRIYIYLSFLAGLLVLGQLSSVSPTGRKKSAIPLSNPKFFFTPRVFKSIEWAFRAHHVLTGAYKKFGDNTVFRIDRGDLDLVVIPRSMIPELNLLPETVINSRQAHATNLSANFTGMEVVLKTMLHFRVLQHKMTPALPRFAEAMRNRLCHSLSEGFPSSDKEWRSVQPYRTLSMAVCDSTALVLVGKPLCDDVQYVETVLAHSQNVFGTITALRLWPRSVQRLVGHVLPARRRCAASLRYLEQALVPEMKRRASLSNAGGSPNVLTWMMQKAESKDELNPRFLARLLAVTAAGAIETTAALVTAALFDLVAHPHFFDEIREEVRKVDEEVGGCWDHSAFQRLVKIDSALKESMRLHPPIMVIYNRLVLQDHVLSNGVLLEKDQLICTLTPKYTDEGNMPEYDALRSFRKDYQRHITRPLWSLDDFAWGAGRAACPGRFMASLEAKTIMAKLVNDFDWRFAKSGSQSLVSTVCELLLRNKDVQLEARRRPGLEAGMGLYEKMLG